LASACGINKIVAKRLFREAGLPVAAEVVVHASEDPRKAAAHTAEQLGEDVIVKPSAEGSAVGVAFARNRDELIQALSAAAEFGEDILVEERIEGAEITVGVIEGKRPLASPLVEVRTPEGSWYDYEHRYTPGLSEHVIPADLAAGPSERVRGLAVAAHEALFCRDLSRVDFMVASDGRAAVLEVNTIPGMTPTSLYPDAMMAAGVEFPELTAYLVRRALARGRATTASAA
jgi:D-alanine-D-alanine ligase